MKKVIYKKLKLEIKYYVKYGCEYWICFASKCMETFFFLIKRYCLNWRTAVVKSCFKTSSWTTLDIKMMMAMITGRHSREECVSM